MVLILIGTVASLIIFIILILAHFNSKGMLSTGVPDGTLLIGIVGVVCIMMLTIGFVLVESRFNQFKVELDDKIEQRKNEEVVEKDINN